MRNFELELIGTDHDFGGDRLAFRVGGVGVVGGPVLQRAGGAFDGTGQSPSSPGNANIADGPQRHYGTKSEGAPRSSDANKSWPAGTNDANKGRRPRNTQSSRPTLDASAGQANLGTKPRGGLRAV